MQAVFNYSEGRSCNGDTPAVIQLIGSQFQSAATSWNDFDVNCRPSSSSAADNVTLEPTGVDQSLPVWHVAIFGLLAVVVGVLTVSGNLIVILSFVLERSIRQPTNYFIASLAVSDLLIGCVSMPFYTVYLLSGKYWPLGEALCDLWLSIDYTACLCSIYTVFCITADRYCSVRFPASYRKWRTERKVAVIVSLTWIVPMAVFFTSIFGWQHFVGYRSVPSGMCYVQYMEDALFNCLLQVGYFWITLAAMIALYVGIYRIAVGLHRRAEQQRERSIACLVSMAGGTVTQIGSVIGMTRTTDGRTTRLEPADTGVGSTDRRRQDDDEEDDDDDEHPPPSAETHQFASRLPTLLLPATSFALFGRLGASKRPQAPAATVSHKPTAPSDARLREPDKTPDCDAVKKELSPSPQTLSPAVMGSERTSCAVDARIEQPAAVRRRRDAASAVAARPEDLHDLPFFDDDDVEDERQRSSNFSNASRGSKKASKFGDCERACEHRTVRLVAAAGDDAIHGCGGVQKHGEDAVLPVGSCNGGRTLATQSSFCASSHQQQRQHEQRHHRFTSGIASHVWHHVVVHKEGRHAENRLQKASESNEKEALLKASSCHRHGEAERKRLQQLSRSNNRTRKALRTITIILGAFMVCWIPWHVLSLIIGFSCDEPETPSCPVPHSLYDVSYWLCYLNSPINPFCYAFVNQQFKKTFIRIIRLDWRRS